MNILYYALKWVSANAFDSTVTPFASNALFIALSDVYVVPLYVTLDNPDKKNALIPIDVTLFGIVILVNPEYENAPPPILVKPFCNSTFVKFAVPPKASTPIDVTLDGIVILVICVPANAR